MSVSAEWEAGGRASEIGRVADGDGRDRDDGHTGWSFVPAKGRCEQLRWRFMSSWREM